MHDMPSFPFAQLYQLAVLRLGLAPSEFWNMTPRELFVLLRAILPPAPPDRATLNDLLRRFGD